MYMYTYISFMYRELQCISYLFHLKFTATHSAVCCNTLTTQVLTLCWHCELCHTLRVTSNWQVSHNFAM